jgi:hypothetical protein
VQTHIRHKTHREARGRPGINGLNVKPCCILAAFNERVRQARIGFYIQPEIRRIGRNGKAEVIFNGIEFGQVNAISIVLLAMYSGKKEQ